jgi:hypothetical protein
MNKMCFDTIGGKQDGRVKLVDLRALAAWGDLHFTYLFKCGVSFSPNNGVFDSAGVAL